LSEAERGEAAFWATFLRNRNVDAGTAADGAVAVAGGYALCVAGTMLTYAVGAGSTRPLRADDLEVVEGFYAVRGLPARFELELATLRRDEDLFRSRGYVDEPVELEVFAGPVSAAARDERVTVRKTTDRGGFCDLLVRAAAEQIHDVGVLHRSAQLNAAAAGTMVIASLDGEDVGVGALGVTGDTAVLFSGAVLPAYRRRGVHTALVAARLNLAAGLGVATAMLKTVAGSPAAQSAARFGMVKAGERRRVAREG